jgi:NAD(P)-dependent dehydrogenase (short-subunit alcohol dehydrogenase family)
MSNQSSSSGAARPAALVTGSAVRLGRAIAIALAQNGYDIALHYRSSADQAETTAAEIRALGASCVAFQADLADAESIPTLLSEVTATFPDLDLLVNSASAYTQATIADTTPEIFDTQFGVNLRAPFFLTQAFARTVERGQVINIIDNKISFNQFEYAAYLLAKKGLVELTKMAALEFAPAIRVNGVAPGVVLPASSRSEEYVQWRIQGIPLRMQGDVAHITGAILSLLDNPFITGQILVVDGGESLTNVGQNAAQFDQDKV